MTINHISNPALFAQTVNRESNPILMKSLSELLGMIHHLKGVDGETRSRLYEVAVNAVFTAEENAFDKAAELQRALDSDEMTVHEE